MEDIRMREENCIFCKLANGVIPTNTLYEDDMFRVIFDVSPATKGHALILPKEHYADIYEIDATVLGKAAQLAQKVIRHVSPILKCDGYNLLQNNGTVAGQTVFHFHLHVIPRYEGDGQKIGWVPGTVDPETQEELVKKLSAALS
jgi:histidine triad (HIT) family protein